MSAATAAATFASTGRRNTSIRIAFQRPSVWIPLVFLLTACGLALLAPFVILHVLETTPSAMDFRNVLSPPSAQHPLGTDHLGRDVAARLLSGAPVSLAIGVIAAVLTGCLALVVGLTSGYFGGWLDNLLMRITDTLMSLPSFFVVLVIAAMTTLGIPELIVLIALLQWMYPARLIRGEVLSLKSREFVVAAHATGATDLRVLLRHVLPGVAPTLLVASTLAVAWAILTESALSYLGVGVRPPQPSWGNMLSDAQAYLYTAPLLAVLPGVCIVATVLAINLLGDRLLDLFDPRLRS